MNLHSNIAPAVQLAKQLYNDCPTPKPAWDQLQAYGPCQQVWIERAEKLMKLPQLDAYEQAELDARAKILLSVPPIIEYIPL